MCETRNEDHLTRCSACGAAKAEKVWTPPTPPPKPPQREPVRPVSPLPRSPKPEPVKPVSPQPVPAKPSQTASAGSILWGPTTLYYVLRWIWGFFLACAVPSLLLFGPAPAEAMFVLCIPLILLLLVRAHNVSSGRRLLSFFDVLSGDLARAAGLSKARRNLFLFWAGAILSMLLFYHLSEAYGLDESPLLVLGAIVLCVFVYGAPSSDVSYVSGIYKYLNNGGSLPASFDHKS